LKNIFASIYHTELALKFLKKINYYQFPPGQDSKLKKCLRGREGYGWVVPQYCLQAAYNK
jgi:hypothetical protein